ncbi:MAG: Matrixin [Armatimonadota bacterium]
MSITRRTLLLAPLAGLVASRAGAEPMRPAEEFRLLPLRVHVLQSELLTDLHCKLADADLRRVLGKVNGIWRPAGIQFFPESIRRETAGAESLLRSLGGNRTLDHLPLARPRESRSDRMFHVYYIREMGPNGICFDGSGEKLFVKETARLNPVPDGIDEPLPRVTAHEIGHALRLPHRQDRTNLMASGTNGTSLNEEEIGISRAAAEALEWHLKPAPALSHAESLREQQPEAAADLLEVLALLPDGPTAQAARAARRALRG